MTGSIDHSTERISLLNRLRRLLGMSFSTYDPAYVIPCAKCFCDGNSLGHPHGETDDDYDPATDPQRKHLYIQWKGVEACLDLFCVCGHDTHFDGYFAYNLRCVYCQRAYAVPDTVPLVELSAERVKELDDRELIKTTELNDDEQCE